MTTSCKYCGEHNMTDKLHSFTATHKANEFNFYNKKKIEKDYTNDEWKDVMTFVANYKDYLEDGYYECIECEKQFTDMNVMLDHEVNCFGARPLILPTIDSAIKSTLSCSDCGKQFHDRGQKMKPKYSLKAHLKKGSCFKKLKSNIIDKLNYADINKLKDIMLLLNNE